jgi:putative ABC transport system substrate-binding protein
MRRREFITLLGGAATAWPLAVRAQRPERLRRIGVLISLAAHDKEAQARLAAFVQGLQELGWTDGRNVRIDTRWAAGNVDDARKYATELAALAPDVILASGGSVVAALLRATNTIPIVFTQTPDPVGAGFVESLARPGGNATGFLNFDYSIGGKWLELAVIRDPATAQGIGQFSAVQSLAPSFSLEVTPVSARDAGEIERTIAAVGRAPNSGLIVTGGGFAIAHRELIITLAARYKLPAIYFVRFFATAGGLISYGPDAIDPHRRAATYVDRILNGEKPADLPVQAPNKYDLVINLKTAKALGLTVPQALLATANEVIE